MYKCKDFDLLKDHMWTRGNIGGVSPVVSLEIKHRTLFHGSKGNKNRTDEGRTFENSFKLKLKTKITKQKEKASI